MTEKRDSPDENWRRDNAPDHPVVADAIRQHPGLRALARAALSPLVALAQSLDGDPERDL